MTISELDRDTGTWPDAQRQRDKAPFELPPRFELVRPLGGGGQGAVWLAEDRVLKQRVALKVTHAEARTELRRRLLQEAQVGRDLAHPHLIRVFDLIEIPERLVIVMEWLPGGSLKARLVEEGPLPIMEVIGVAEQVLEVLAYLHERGVVHRDLKPSNLLLDREGGVKLADLGLVRQLERSEDLTRTGLTVGTPNYMSPEQLQGEPPAPGSDLYGLGVTLFELLTGQRPFTGSSDLMVANQHLGAMPPSVRTKRPDCPRWLAGFVARLLEKKPSDRWPDATAALAALRARRAPRWRVWRQRALASAVILATAVAVWALLASRQPRLAEVVVDRHQLAGVSADGRELWRREFLHPVTAGLVADVVAEEGSEAVVSLRGRSADGRFDQPVVVVLDRRGRELDRFDVDVAAMARCYPELTPDFSVSNLRAGDLDGDGLPELLWSGSHPFWYPGMIGTWWGRRGGVQKPLMVNSGRLFDLMVDDLDGDGQPELAAVGVNNPLGYEDVLTVVDLDGPMSFSPDLLAHGSVANIPDYILMGPFLEGRIAGSSSSGVLRVRRKDQIFERTPDGRFSAEAADIDKGARQRFWEDLITLCRDAAAQPMTALAERDEVMAPHERILGDPDYRSASKLLLARSLARAGAHSQAIEVLRQSTEQDPQMVDSWLRLGEQLLIAGDRDSGRAALLRCLTTRRAGRNPYDAMVMLTLDAAVHGDRELLEQARRQWKSYALHGVSNHFQSLRLLLPFAAGEWRDPLLESEPETLYAPLRVLPPWAALEAGGDPRVALDQAAALSENPEAHEVAQLFEARALLADGEAERALWVVTEAATKLQTRGRESYESYVWVPVAEWVHGSVLAALGRPEEAQAHFDDAARRLPGSVFARPPRPPRRDRVQ